MGIYACSICYFGASEDPMNISLRAAIITMLAVLVFVLSLFVKFFLSVRQRSMKMAQVRN